MKPQLLTELDSVREFFLRSTSCLTEENSSFAPAEGSLTASQQVAHVAQTIDWFVDGVQSPTGFDLDFEKHWRDVMPVVSLNAARDWFQRSIDRAKSVVAEMSTDELLSPLPEGPVMGGQPKLAIVGSILDHTAHHRGALSVYSRLLGKTPPMPYM
jgi:uncharacterized damage-inducible protein DinB